MTASSSPVFRTRLALIVDRYLRKGTDGWEGTRKQAPPTF